MPAYTALLPNRTYTIPSSGLKYAYIHHSPTQPSKPTLLFIHGFPATSHDWQHQIRHFVASGYGIIAPDCLGYGQTSKPDTVESYIGHNMAADMIAILDHEKVRKVVGISHDWGTYLLSQIASWFPERLEKAVFFSVPFTPPGRGLDVRRINETTRRKKGFEQYGYQIFLASEGAGKIIGDHWESFFSLLYPGDPKEWSSSMAPTNALKTMIEADTMIPLASYISEIDKAHHHASFGDDYAAPCKWYVRGLDNLGVDEEKQALKEGKMKAKLEIPTLMIGGLRDAVCPADQARASMRKTVEGGEKGGLLRVVDVDAGHWIMLEKVEETNRVLTEFIEGRNGLIKASL